MAPGIHSGRSRGAAVFETIGGAAPGTVVSGLAPLSGATLAMLERPTSLLAARSPAQRYRRRALQRENEDAQGGPQGRDAPVQTRRVALYSRDERATGIGATPDEDRLARDSQLEVFGFERKREPCRSRSVVREHVRAGSA